MTKEKGLGGEKLNKNNKGFTLIELIVVIAIIGILGAIAVPTYSSLVGNAKTSADEATIGYLNRSTQLYYAGETSTNPFEIIDTPNDALIQVLVDEGFFYEKPIPKQKDVSFIWDYSKKIWLLSNDASEVYSILSSDVVLGTGGHTGYIKGSYSGTEKDIIITKTLDGTTLTNIWQDTFANKGITSLNFSADSEITRIHARAFNENKLTEVVLNNSLKQLDFGAFWNNDITKVTIGSDVILADQVFRNDNSFRDAYYENGAGTYIYKDDVWVKE